MTETLYRSRGWSAVWKGKRPVRYKLPGDTPGTVAAMHALTAAGMLALNVMARELPDLAAFPMRARHAVWGGQQPSVCTGCRAEQVAAASPEVTKWVISMRERRLHRESA